MSDNGNGNGNKNGKERPEHTQGRYRLGTDSEMPAGESTGDIEELARVVKELKLDIASLTLVVADHLKQMADAAAQEKAHGHQLEALIEKVMLPIAEMNRQLRDREVDFNILLPKVLVIIGIIDRQYIEIPATDQMVIQFGAIENARKADQQELLQLLATFDIEQYAVRAGTKLDPSMHTITKTKRVDSSKVGRVIAMLKHGYRRRDWVIRPAWVEVGIPGRSQQT